MSEERTIHEQLRRAANLFGRVEKLVVTRLLSFEERRGLRDCARTALLAALAEDQTAGDLPEALAAGMRRVVDGLGFLDVPAVVTVMAVTKPRCAGCGSADVRHESGDRHQCNACGWRSRIDAAGRSRDWLDVGSSRGSNVAGTASQTAAAGAG